MRSTTFSTFGAGARLANCFSSSAMRRRNSRGSSAFAFSMVAAIRSRRRSMSTGASCPGVLGRCPTVGVADESKVSRLLISTRRKTSSQPSDQNQAVPIGSDGCAQPGVG